jgi:hypothetical protein
MQLADARIQLHWAVQVVSSLADRRLPPAADDSHTSMEWRAGALHGQAGLALRVAELALERGAEVYPLRGRTLREAFSWAEAGAPRDYDMPAHALQDGAAFDADAGALAELALWYGAADTWLRELAAGQAAALPVRCWPHHFDLASISYPDGTPGRDARQIGFGLSPGDGYHEAPYWYLTPYPVAAGARFAELDGGGVWQPSGFTGAVLVGVRDEPAVRAFFASAFAAARALLA